VTIRPKPQDIDLLDRLIEMRDAAQFAGVRDDVFRLFDFNGTESVLFSPSRNEGIDVSTLGMRRLQDLGLFHLVDRLDKGFTFDLVDDVRDRREEMQVALGQPSRMGELEAALGRAEGVAEVARSALRDRAAGVASAARARADLRAAFARRVGRRVLWAARAALGFLYAAVVVIAGYFVSSNLPLAFVVGVIGLFVVLAAVDWLLHIDGFALAARAEAWAVVRVTRWLEKFEASEPD
jgi:hypothetical protein